VGFKQRLEDHWKDVLASRWGSTSGKEQEDRVERDVVFHQELVGKVFAITVCFSRIVA